MVENNKYMLLSMSVIIHKLVCDWLLRLPPPRLFTIFYNPDWVYICARLCISKSIDDCEMHFARP